MSHFKARRRGGAYVALPPYAAGLLASLARQLVELLSDGEVVDTQQQDPLEAMLDFDAPREAPEDPALLRLLPSAHRDDEEVAAEFRRFTERGLRESKIRDSVVVLTKLGDLTVDAVDDVEFELDRDEVRAFLRALTDMRLTLAERLGVTVDDDQFWESLPDDDERLAGYEIYGWLGYLLESLLDVVRR